MTATTICSTKSRVVSFGFSGSGSTIDLGTITVRVAVRRARPLAVVVMVIQRSFHRPPTPTLPRKGGGGPKRRLAFSGPLPPCVGINRLLNDPAVGPSI